MLLPAIASAAPETEAPDAAMDAAEAAADAAAALVAPAIAAMEAGTGGADGVDPDAADVALDNCAVDATDGPALAARAAFAPVLGK